MTPGTRPGRRRQFRYSAMVVVALMALGGAGAESGSPAPAVDGHNDHPLFAAARPEPPAAAPPVIPNANMFAMGPASTAIPATVLAAYHRAADSVARTDPACGLDWTVLAAIGKVESNHARGGDVTASGAVRHPIFGPVLDGSDGMAMIMAAAGDPAGSGGRFARAEGPMQFLPSTWAKWAADGTGDGTRDVQNIFDATLGAAHYLCAGDLDLASGSGLRDAILRYNPSTWYLGLVSYWIRVYDNGAGAVPDQPLTAEIPGETILADAPGPSSAKSPAAEGKHAPASPPAPVDRQPPPNPPPAPPADSPTKQLLKPVTQLVNGVTQPLVRGLLG